MTTEPDPRLAPLDRLVGTWTTEATHPMVPGVVVHGTAVVEWLEGRRFLSYRYSTDHPDFPGALSVIGNMEQDRADDTGDTDGAAPPDADASPLRMHYFDSRGVFRIYDASMDDGAWRLWRDAPGFSQRFTGHLSDDGDAIAGTWQLRRDDEHWADDLRITYRRVR